MDVSLVLLGTWMCCFSCLLLPFISFLLFPATFGLLSLLNGVLSLFMLNVIVF